MVQEKIKYAEILNKVLKNTKYCAEKILNNVKKKY